MKRISATVATLLVATFFAAGPASASQLGVNVAGSAALLTNSPCASQGLVATTSGTGSAGSYSGISVSGFDAACQGQAVTIDLYAPSGAPLATGSVPSGSATTTFTTASYTAADVASAVVKIDGWVFVATWVPPADQPAISCRPVNNGGNVVQGAGQTCNATITGMSGWISYPGAWGVGPPNYHYSINFSVNSSQNQWEVTFNFADASVFTMYNSPPVYVGSGYNVVNAPGYSCSSLPIYAGRKAAGNVPTQNSGVLYVTSAPGSTNGTTPLCQ